MKVYNGSIGNKRVVNGRYDWQAVHSVEDGSHVRDFSSGDLFLSSGRRGTAPVQEGSLS